MKLNMLCFPIKGENYTLLVPLENAMLLVPLDFSLLLNWALSFIPQKLFISLSGSSMSGRPASPQMS